jgi:hypothetical protein
MNAVTTNFALTTNFTNVMICQFALRLICGMSLMWALMPRRQVTSGFFRIQNLVVLGLGVLAALTAEMGTGQIADVPMPKLGVSDTQRLSILISVAGFAGSVWWTLERRKVGELFGFAVLAMSLAALTLPQLGHGRISLWAFLWPCSQLLNSAVLGGAFVGMLLGHWYLTAPTMSIEPLKRVNLMLGIAGAARLLLSAFGLYLCFRLTPIRIGHESDVVLGVFRWVEEFHSITWIWLALRWLAGILGPLGVSLMVWRILKYRNTQAATGVLFVGVILSFIGDTTAALLLRQIPVPF